MNGDDREQAIRVALDVGRSPPHYHLGPAQVPWPCGPLPRRHRGLVVTVRSTGAHVTRPSRGAAGRGPRTVSSTALAMLSRSAHRNRDVHRADQAPGRGSGLGNLGREPTSSREGIRSVRDDRRSWLRAGNSEADPPLGLVARRRRGSGIRGPTLPARRSVGRARGRRGRRRHAACRLPRHLARLAGNPHRGPAPHRPARCTRDADKLEMLLQAVEYRETGVQRVQGWIESAPAGLTTRLPGESPKRAPPCPRSLGASGELKPD